MLAELAAVACDRVADRHATFTRANLLAEIHRQLHGVRFAHPDERVTAAEHTADLALELTVRVTAPGPLHVPHRWRRPDGTTQLLPADHISYTTTALLDAENRLLAHGRATEGPAVPIDLLSQVLARPVPGPSPRRLSLDQAVAVERIATSGRRLDVLVGPAGTGKTTTLAGLRTVWETAHGPGSVVGLAPSAAAAEALATELGVDTENTAKWLHEHARNLRRRQQLDQLPVGHRRAARLAEEIARWEFRPGQLVIVDEASLAGTLSLDALAAAAEDVGAKLLLAGAPYQLSPSTPAASSAPSSVTAATGSPSSATSAGSARHGRKRPQCGCAWATAPPSTPTKPTNGSLAATGKGPWDCSTQPGAPTSMPAGHRS